MKHLAIAVAILLGSANYAQAELTRTYTIVCLEQSDVVEIIDLHVTKGDAEAVKLGAKKVVAGVCELHIVTIDNPLQLVVTYSKTRDNFIFAAITLVNKMTALVSWVGVVTPKTTGLEYSI